MKVDDMYCMERFNLILLLSEWFKGSTAIVCWNGAVSAKYEIWAGVRQGGVLSPVLFSIYVDAIISSLQLRGLGCHIGLHCLSVLMYADDLVLASCSVSELQLMINLCTDELNNLDLLINVKKSVCMQFGKHRDTFCFEMSINSTKVSWSNSMSYLGVKITSSFLFCIDLKPVRSKFYRSFNALYSKISKANEQLIISLLKTFCVPVIMYSVEAFVLNTSSLRSLDGLLLNSFGKIFKTYDNNILSQCMYYMNVLPIRYDYCCRRLNFLFKLAKSRNSLLTLFYNLNGQCELSDLCVNNNICCNNSGSIKPSLWKLFASNLHLS